MYGPLETFEELVCFALNLGATHMTMANWHEGAFWQYTTPPNLDLFDKYVLDMYDRVRPGWRERKNIYAVARFYDTDRDNYFGWMLTSFVRNLQSYKLTDKFIPIDSAITWYYNWNSEYTGTK
jgi:hypothetical protein